MTADRACPKLDPREEHFTIPGPHEGLSIFVRRLAPVTQGPTRAVLYVHGATFPSGLSIAHRFNGLSWRDALCAAGFDVWGFDFYGFGYSDRYKEMNDEEDKHGPLGVAKDCAKQLEIAVRFILAHIGAEALSIISHSWGSMPVGQFACSHPTLLDRWVLFAPIAKRAPLRYEPTPRINGIASSKMCQPTKHRFSPGVSSMNGHRRILILIRTVEREPRRASRHRLAPSARSSRPGMAHYLTNPRKCARLWRSSGANGTAFCQTQMLGGYSTRFHALRISETSKSHVARI